MTEVTDKATSQPGASVLSLFFILIGVYGQVEAYCLQVCVHEDTTLEVAFVDFFFFFSYHLGFFSTKKYPANERWDLLKGRKFVFFIIACPTPNTIPSTLVVSCSIVSDSLQPHELLAHQAPLSMEFSRQDSWSG